MLGCHWPPDDQGPKRYKAIWITLTPVKSFNPHRGSYHLWHYGFCLGEVLGLILAVHPMLLHSPISLHNVIVYTRSYIHAKPFILDRPLNFAELTLMQNSISFTDYPFVISCMYGCALILYFCASCWVTLSSESQWAILGLSQVALDIEDIV